ncbi:HAD family hydrolase [Mesorhizobium sp. UC22_110]|jgi:HAD superfamily hydrolase (TIGR01509 family)|uniref:HAD family hydrolase n=1 Tax=unclassified Mesorhizobium TaxID=325217 RepID=UPI003671682F
MTPKAVFWDMDGTLVDSEPLHDAALVSAMRSVGLEAPADLHERVLGKTAAFVYDMMRDEFGLTLPFDEWIALKYDYYMANVAGLQPRPGAIEIYQELRALGVPQAVVSNSDRLIVDANLGAVGLSHAGMKTVSRNDVREGKPHPEPFLRAAWLFGVDPGEAVAIDDSVTGAMSGLAAGMKTIFWPERPMPGPDGAVVIDTADELRAELGL